MRRLPAVSEAGVVTTHNAEEQPPTLESIAQAMRFGRLHRIADELEELGKHSPRVNLQAAATMIRGELEAMKP